LDPGFVFPPVRRNRSFSHGLKDGISFDPADKIDSLAGPSAPKLIVGIASVVRDDGPGGKREFRYHFDIAVRAFFLNPNLDKPVLP
jgi:hypothetical protein